jgi:hypothetical protein
MLTRLLCNKEGGKVLDAYSCGVSSLSPLAVEIMIGSQAAQLLILKKKFRMKFDFWGCVGFWTMELIGCVSNVPLNHSNYSLFWITSVSE